MYLSINFLKRLGVTHKQRQKFPYMLGALRHMLSNEFISYFQTLINMAKH